MSSSNRRRREGGRTFEFALASDDIAGRSTLNAAVLNVVYDRTHSSENDDANDSGDEPPNFNSRYLRRALHRMRVDEEEASDDTSDVSEDVTPMDPTTYRQHAICNGRPVANEEDRGIYEEYFGNPNRLPQAPSGRGWENTRLIAAGARPSRLQYGRSEDAWNNTSLNPPEPTSSDPAFSRAADRRRAAREQEAHELIDRLEARQEAREERRYEQIDEERWEALGATAVSRTNLRLHRQSGEMERLEQELVNRIREFRQSDPEAYAEWQAFAGVANRATVSRSRQLQILQWYTGGPSGSIHDPARRVPQGLLRQLRRYEQWYTEEARLETSLHVAQMEDESRPELSPRKMIAANDNYWGFHTEQVFGYERREFRNGFSDYIARGPGGGARLLDHLRANWEVREMRLLHASHTEHRELWRRMVAFAQSTRAAFAILNQHYDSQSASARAEHVRPLEITISEFPDQIYQFRGPHGYNATASVPGRDRNVSPFEAIRNRIPMTNIPPPLNIANATSALSAMAATLARNGSPQLGTPSAGSEDQQAPANDQQANGEESDNEDGYIADEDTMDEDA
jgi:hypothetical protein